jgi:hypothetical protein
MYSVDEKDRVVELTSIPAADSGSPEVALFATEHRLVLVYSVPGLEVGQIGPSGRTLLPEDIPPGYDPLALVEFVRPRAHLFGPPNDEAFHGHPLALRGLRPYGSYVIEESSWIRSLERMNRVHPRHRPESYRDLRHYVVAFHDKTFECVAAGVDGRVHEHGAPELARTLRQLSRISEVTNREDPTGVRGHR